MLWKEIVIRCSRKLITKTHSSLRTRRTGRFGINVLCKESEKNEMIYDIILSIRRDIEIRITENLA